eukprot:TRINITY_DN10058_c1_g1_i1.p1 TRINITY_DN10058_c1_g1~~TRINITY_DN10058_c1_g1_i1.p1  ORF type:complete len:319 (+),score=44.74 TRINITY_DN10058_c1_g1_i1:215-1171(+)
MLLSPCIMGPSCRSGLLWAAFLFLGVTAQYDETIAKSFAAIASATYCPGKAESVLNWTCKVCQESNTPLVPGKIKIIDDGISKSSRILVGKLQMQHGCVVAFRGSDNIPNWIRNLQFWKVNPTIFEDCDGCLVEDGFYTIWKNVRDDVLAALKDVGCAPVQNNADNLLYITGHSLGGALTHLAMFNLQKHGFKLAKSYSFEAPRAGNKAFSDAFSDRFTRHYPVYRLTHSMDPVPHLPLEAMGFTHVQTEIFYDSEGKYKECPNVEDVTCADQYGNVPELILLHAGEHCASPLVASGDICSADCSVVSVASNSNELVV